MDSSGKTFAWNVRLPKDLEDKVLRSLTLPDRTRAIDSLANQNSELATKIRAWASQAYNFRDVATAAPDPETANPDQIGEYRIIRPLGEGGFGTVFLAQLRDGDRPVALKVLRRSSAFAATAIQREFELLARLDHPAVVNVHGFGTTGSGHPYYAMDFIAGRVFDSFFNNDVFSNVQFATALLQICDGLSYVHHKQIIHRDIKPQNILVDFNLDQPRAHLVDFGIASCHADTRRPPESLRMVKAGHLFEQTLVTQSGQVIGTPAFMSPEQIIDSNKVDPRADIYSLGVTIYLMLTGRFPVAPKEILRALQAGQDSAYQTVVSTQVEAPTEVAKNLTERDVSHPQTLTSGRRISKQLTRSQRQRLDQVVLKCLAKEPEKRFSNTVQLSEQLAWAFGLPKLLLQVPARFGGVFLKSLARILPKRKKPSQRDHLSDVWFITNRKTKASPSAECVFGRNESDTLTFGRSTVWQPKWHMIGRTQPRWWEFLLRRQSYSVVQHAVIDEAQFTKELFERNHPSGILIFIHGYNTTFDQAVIRAAQLQADLKMNGSIVCYSWPSQGSVFGYGVDAAIADESEQFLMNAIKALSRLSGSPALHVLAHSMGNRMLLRALSRLHDMKGLSGLGQILLAAPDVSQRLFRQLCSVYVEKAKRCTLYASKHDRALMGSRFLYARGRVGYIPPVMIMGGIDTIDASRLGFRLWGLNHSGYGDVRELLTDIATLIRHDSPPEHRIGLERQIDPVSGAAYWVCIK